MNKSVIFAGGLIAGAAGGCFVSYKMLKDRFEQKTEEEIASVRETLLQESKARREAMEAAKKEQEKAAVQAVKTYSATSKEAEKAAAVLMDKPKKKPYVIPPDVLEDDSNPHKRVGIKLYADGIVTDMGDRPIDDKELAEKVGPDALSHFGEYDDDRVCIRNEALETDFEIVRLYRDYSELIRMRK